MYKPVLKTVIQFQQPDDSNIPGDKMNFATDHLNLVNSIVSHYVEMDNNFVHLCAWNADE